MQARSEDSWSLTDSLVFCIAGSCRKGGIHILDGSARVGKDYVVRCLFDNSGKQDQRLKCLAALREILKQHDTAGNQAGRILQGPRIYANPGSRTLLRIAHKDELIGDDFASKSREPG